MICEILLTPHQSSQLYRRATLLTIAGSKKKKEVTVKVTNSQRTTRLFNIIELIMLTSVRPVVEIGA